MPLSSCGVLIITSIIGMQLGRNVAVFAQPRIMKPFVDGVPGSGYGCDNPCSSGDVNYVIRAHLKEYAIAGSRNAPGFVTTDPGNVDVTMFTRTFEGDKAVSSPFCFDDDGTSGPLNPCLTVAPNQTLNIKVINEMVNGIELLFQEMTPVQILNSYGQDFPDFQDGQNVTNVQNTPGVDVTFDETNIHLHGMQVVPHLFYPQGTANASSDWITITPSNKLNGTQTCFCYVFDITEDHPQGSFFWHIHRHGSASMQSWAGMAGLLQVGNANTTGSPEHDLAQQGIERHVPLVLWEWASAMNNSDATNPNTYYEGPFQITPDNTILTFMANNEYQPTFLTMTVNETVHVPFLCAQTSTGSALWIVDASGESYPFWVFAADGISYSKAVRKEMIVVGPGQREGLLLQFPRAGRYSIMQYILNDAFNFTNDAELPVAYVEVTDTQIDVPPIDILSLAFQPGMPGQDINASEVAHQVDLVFNIDQNSTGIQVPHPIFTIDGQMFDVKGVQQSMAAGTAAEWTMRSKLGFHPFHIQYVAPESI